MFLKLMYITNSVDVALIAEKYVLLHAQEFQQSALQFVLHPREGKLRHFVGNVRWSKESVSSRLSER